MSNKIKPTALKKLEGNPGKRPLPKNEPQPDPSMPKMPWWFDYHARQEWQRICPELHRLGLLTSIDRAALVGYCMAYSRWLKAERELLKGLTYEKIDANGNKKRINKPEVNAARDALNQVRLFCVEFGLTPSSRAKMSMSPPKPKRDPMEELLDYCRESTQGQP